MLRTIAQTGAAPMAYSVGIASTAVGGMNANTHSSVLGPLAAENEAMYANSSGSMIGKDAPWASSTRAHSEPAAANALQYRA